MKYFFLLFFLSTNLAAKISIITTTPDLAWMAKEIGQDLIKVESLLYGTEDPHYIDVVPSFIAKVSKADIVCAVGFDLEVGWLPRVLARSGKAHLQPGGKGYCELGRAVTALGKVEGKIDRSMGDVHAGGNPHFTLSPSAFLQGATEIVSALKRVDAKNAEAYETQFEVVKEKLLSLEGELREKIKQQAPQLVFMEYHRDFLYFNETYKVNSIGALEEIPGVLPSAAQLARRSIEAREAGVKILMAGLGAPENQLKRFQELSQVPFIKAPLILETSGSFSDYVYLQRFLVDKLIEYANK